MIARRAVSQLVDVSRVVFRLCALPNGAIVAARSDLPGYPETLQDYGLVWPRDAAFACAAAHRIGLHAIQQPFWRWLLQRAEGFGRSGRLSNVYFPNGETAGVLLQGATAYVSQVQWDAVGTVLWAIADEQKFVKRLSVSARRVMQLGARWLERAWQPGQLGGTNWDVWEERLADGRRGEFHAYSVGMVIRGLEAAESVLGSKPTRRKLIGQLRRRLETAYQPKRRLFVRTVKRGQTDMTFDMSLLGLVWPAQQVAANDPRLTDTLQQTLRRCALPNGGYRRYANDRYSGVMRAGKVVGTGAGAWPWLSAWVAIVLAEQGHRTDAQQELAWVLRQSRGRILPEQFRTDKQPSVPGLAVSHAFAVFAAERLGLLGRQP